MRSWRGIVEAERVQGAGIDSSSPGALPAELLLESLETPVYVLTWGANFAGQLGNGTKQERDEEPRVLQSLNANEDHGVLVAAHTHTACVTAAGQLYCWGPAGPRLGQRRLEQHGSTSYPAPLLLLPLTATRIVAVACGAEHTLCLDGALCESEGGVCAARGCLLHRQGLAACRGGQGVRLRSESAGAAGFGPHAECG